MTIVWFILNFAWQALVVFVVSTLLFDVLHYLLHRWGRSTSKLLRTFAAWHWVHHAFLDRHMRVHLDLTRKNLIYHVMPEYLTSLAGTLIFLLVFPWPPVAAIAVLRTWMLVLTIRDEGIDGNHMAMDRVSGRQGLFWVSAHYHAMHHIYPENFYSSFSNVFDLFAGTTCQISGRRFLVTGANGAFGSAIKARLEKLGGIVETAKSGVDFAAGDYDRMDEKLARAQVLVLAHGAKTDGAWDANYTTFVDLVDRFIEVGKARLIPPEVWALGSEAEFHGDMGMAELKDYAASKRAYAQQARGYYQNPALIYRHIVPSSFRSQMGPGPMSADTAARIALFFIRRGFSYVPVTLTSLALWNYFRFRALKPGPSVRPVKTA
ncbi:MAG: hypothetical protein ABL879_14630 [Devosia sp.]